MGNWSECAELNYFVPLLIAVVQLLKKKKSPQKRSFFKVKFKLCFGETSVRTRCMDCVRAHGASLWGENGWDWEPTRWGRGSTGGTLLSLHQLPRFSAGPLQGAPVSSSILWGTSPVPSCLDSFSEALLRVGEARNRELAAGRCTQQILWTDRCGLKSS